MTPPCIDSRINHRWNWTCHRHIDQCDYCDTTRKRGKRGRMIYTAGKGSGRSSDWRKIEARKAAILEEIRKKKATT